MEISKKMQDAFNAQIKLEFFSANLYLQMAFWFRKEGWKGFANWMYKQNEEERQHALDMAKFVLDRGGVPVLTAIDAVPTEYESPKDAFEKTLEHEREVSAAIDKLADVADEEHDRAAANFIAKYVDEQVEEEKNVRDILDVFRHRAGQAHAMTKIDDMLGARA